VAILTPLVLNPSKELAYKHLRRMIDRESRRGTVAVLFNSRNRLRH
jgi:hypothetical protein